MLTAVMSVKFSLNSNVSRAEHKEEALKLCDKMHPKGHLVICAVERSWKAKVMKMMKTSMTVGV